MEKTRSSLLLSRGWLHISERAAGAAIFAFLCVLAGGTLLLLAAKLQVPDLGAGAPAPAVFEAVVIVSLGSLGTPIDVGGLEVMALPLGAVALIGLGIASGTRRALGGLVGGTFSARVRGSLVVGACLGVLCGVAALVFRIGQGSGEIAARPWLAALAGALWGFVWSLLGVTRLPFWDAFRWAFGRSPEVGPARRTAAGEGIRLLLWLTLPALVGVAALGSARVVFRASTPLGALGSLVHGLAFAPNLAAAGAALGLGGTVEAGFGGLASGSSGATPAYSLFDWAGASTPIAAWLLPIIAFVGVTAVGARVARLPGSVTASMLVVGVTFAGALALLAVAGEARAGIVEREGFVRLAPDALQVFFLGLGWAAVGLPLGWIVARAKRRENHRDHSETG